jgi:hypothetical protein
MGSATPEISSIRALVARTRRRLRRQRALEGATTATILAAAAALAVVYGVRAYILAPGEGVVLLVGCALIVVAGAVIGALGRIDDERVARQLDRASGLADRLSTAVAFDRVLRAPAGAAPHDPETRELMKAAIRDAIASAPRADVPAAAPYRAPRDLRLAAVFGGAALVASLLGLPERAPRVDAAEPARACHGGEVAITGAWLCGPYQAGSESCLAPHHRVVFTRGDLSVAPSSWLPFAIALTVPAEAPAGPGTLEVWDGARRVGEVDFTVVDCDEVKRAGGYTLDDDDRSYTEDLLAELRATAARDQIPELEDYVRKVEELLALAEKGDLSKEELLEGLQQAEDALKKGEDPDPAQIDQDLAQTGKELEKNELTRDLGKALQQKDLAKAKQELEKLAEKMAQGELSDKQKQQLAKAMDKAAQAFQKKDAQREQQLQQKIDKAEKEMRRLEKEKEEAKDERQKQDLERRLEKKKRELEQLKKEQDKKEQSEQRRALKRLHKDLEEGAKDLQQKADNQQQDRDNQKQASEKMKSAAEQTGRVDRDQRKTAATKKVSSQMDDLREAMRRAKRRGNQGPKNPFGKNGKQSDFERRARGQKGQRTAWRPGQGQKGPGQGQPQPGGQGGDPQQSNTWGTGHDPNLTGDPTGKSGDTRDEDVQGVHGKGPSRRETVLSAAEKGFASKSYEQVYADYKRVVEEVMRSEKVPSSYKYYVKKYFTKIKPHSMD